MRRKPTALRCRRSRTPIIMIGPGYRHRAIPRLPPRPQGRSGPGKNWLFFGHQRSDWVHFFYGDELNAMKTSGLLTRMSLAWLRDGAKKFYAGPHAEVGREIVTCREGANVYICGDAKRMARTSNARWSISSPSSVRLH